MRAESEQCADWSRQDGKFIPVLRGIHRNDPAEEYDVT